MTFMQLAHNCKTLDVEDAAECVLGNVFWGASWSADTLDLATMSVIILAADKMIENKRQKKIKH